MVAFDTVQHIIVANTYSIIHVSINAGIAVTFIFSNCDSRRTLISISSDRVSVITQLVC